MRISFGYRRLTPPERLSALTFQETKTIWPGVKPAKFNSAAAADRYFHGLLYETMPVVGQEHRFEIHAGSQVIPVRGS
ncbi:hypothetical protein PVA19_18310 [Agrobacterium sp. CNPSo 3708]|uniref:hypothetical protein n=1 Tax=unclassified Agrobacterium TaxID=2632611 RepID=UPI002364490E|nr:hypothetical protein [Agrobacterium sp. CNPSo 3708]MDD1500381.1 hypothetical protein [Agrobacterium sp. CNPSo 3708]